MEAYSHVHSEQLRETDTVSKSQIGLPLHLSLDENDWLTIEESLSNFTRNS
jgi:dTDP-4-amino-4,6-dideoxygalactose transaminase